jgi:hypothetical protein
MNLVYYQDQIKLYWSETKRCDTYEPTVFHGLNCVCCSKVRITDDRNDKRWKSRMTDDEKEEEIEYTQ